MEAVTRLARLGLASMLRVVAVVVVAQLAWWLRLGSHDARAAGGAADTLQQLLLAPHPGNVYLLGCCTRV